MLVEQLNVNPNSADRDSAIQLLCAVRDRHKAVGKMLPEWLNVDSNTANGSDTPHFGAVNVGLEGVVKILLQQLDIHTNTGDKDTNLPLFWVVGEPHNRVMKVLPLRDDSSPDRENVFGWMRLCKATQKVCEHVRQIMLERSDVNPNTVDENSEMVV